MNPRREPNPVGQNIAAQRDAVEFRFVFEFGAQLLEAFVGHAPVGAVAVEKEGAAQFQPEFMDAQPGLAAAEFFDLQAEVVAAIVIS